MIERDILMTYFDELLTPNGFQDYCPNGLQVSGKAKIEKIVTGVSANQALIDAAIKDRADLLLVHHGFFWKGEDPCVVGMKQQRLKKLLAHDINLVAYHLPLDAHQTLGNNVQLARVLDIVPEGQISLGEVPALTWYGNCEKPLPGEAFADLITERLQRQPLHIPGKASKIKTIAWCTGGAQDYIYAAINCGADAFLTGEASERTVDIARENGLHFYAAGHFATERYGVQALGAAVAEQFDLSHQFIEIDNPA